MNDIISTANNFASNFMEDCDFSIDSLEFIEHILEDMRTKELNEDDIYNISTMIGCYVFETARRNYGGVYYWVNSEQQPLFSIPFYIDGYREHIEKGKLEKGYYVNII